MKHKQFTLSNGIESLFVSKRDSNISCIIVTCKVGSKHEDKTNYGISHFLEHMFFKGTHKYKNNKALTSAIESLGGTINAYTSQNTTNFIIKINSNYIKKAIEILSDMLLHSLFRKKDIEYEQNIVITELNKYKDDPLYILAEMFNTTIFKNTPLENMPIGTIETINNITRSSLINYKNKYYTADNLFITITTNLSFTRIQNVLQQSDFIKSESTDIKKNVPFLYTKSNNYTLNVNYKDMEQEKIIIGFPICNIYHKDKYIFECISNLLTGGLSSILFIELREKNSLVYDISSGTEYFNDIGTFCISTGMSLQKLLDYTENNSLFNFQSVIQSYFGEKKHNDLKKGVLHIILDTIIHLIKKKITPIQLKAVINNIKGALLFGNENSEIITSYYSNQLIFNKDTIVSRKKLNKIYDKITIDDIQRVSKQYFTKDNLFVSVLGQSKQYKIGPFLEHFKQF